MPSHSTAPDAAPAAPSRARPRGWSVRLHLTLLILAAALPLVILLGYQLVRDARTDLEEARSLVRGLAEVTAADAATVLRNIRRTASQLAERPLVKALDPDRCDPVLAELRRFEQNYSNVVTFGALGEPVCSARPTGSERPRNVSGMPWFEKARRERIPVTGAPQRGIYTGRWISIVAHPLVDSSGAFRGVVAVAIDLVVFQPVARAALPEGGVMGIVSADGLIVARSSRAEESIGRNVADTPLGRAVMSGKVNTGLIVGNDQIERLYAYQPIPESDWYVTAGVPRELVNARLKQSLTRNGVGAALAVALALLMVSLTYRRFAGPLLALHETVRAIGEGDRARRAPVGGPREIAEVAGTFNEMMDRIPRIEHALVQSEARYRQLFAASPDAVLVMHAGRIVMTNPSACSLLGSTHAQGPVDAPLEHYVAEGNRSRLSAAATAVMAGTAQAPESVEIELPRPDGSSAWAEARLLPFSWNGQDALLAILRDLTARRRLEIELGEHRAEAERMVNELVAKQTAAAIAHELNQPLVAVSAYSEAALAMVRGGAPGGERLAHALEGAAGQAQRAGRTLHELLGILHGGDPGQEPVDLNEVIRELVSDSLATGPSRFVPELDLDPDLPRVTGNRVQLQRVLGNLLQNAIDAMRGEGLAPAARRVVFTSRRVDGEVVVAVRDSGRGPAMDAVPRLFDPFFTTKSRGIGLGLAISRALVESHGGRLWYEPGAAGEPVFQFSLPVAP